MTKVIVNLWRDRMRDGECWLEDEHGAQIGGPWPCLGRADHEYASQHHNPERDSLKMGGDTPTGLARAVTAVSYPTYSTSYGWCFIALQASDGNMKVAEKNGRTGIGLHSGVPNEHGHLRPTYGCIRTVDAAVASIVSWFAMGPVYVEIKERA